MGERRPPGVQQSQGKCRDRELSREPRRLVVTAVVVGRGARATGSSFDVSTISGDTSPLPAIVTYDPALLVGMLPEEVRIPGLWPSTHRSTTPNETFRPGEGLPNLCAGSPRSAACPNQQPSRAREAEQWLSPARARHRRRNSGGVGGVSVFRLSAMPTASP